MESRRRSRFTDAEIDEYAAEHSAGPDEVQRDLQVTTAERTGPLAMMQIGDDQAVLMEILVRAMGARARRRSRDVHGILGARRRRGLGPDGRLLCCDVSEEWTAIGRDAWDRAGVADRIDLRIGPGIDTLRALPTEEQFDFAFIDADKPGYPGYYEEILLRLRTGGLILIDNVLQNGRVIDESATDESVLAIRDLNDSIVKDARVRVVLLPIGDGVSVVQKT